MAAEVEPRSAGRSEKATTPMAGGAPGRKHEERVVVRCWPKIICAYPVALLGLLFALTAWLFPGVLWLHAICGRAFFAVLFLTALIGTFDCRGWHVVTVGLTALSAFLALCVLAIWLPIFQAIAWLWSQADLAARPQVYLFFPLAYLIIVGCAYIANRFEYWEITPNELLHNFNPLSDFRRYPAANIKVEKEIPDVFEWLLLGSGRLIIYPSSDRHAIVLDNVLRVNEVERSIKHLLGALEVRVDQDR